MLHVTEDQPNLETVFPKKEDDVPYQMVHQSLSAPVLAEEADVSAQALAEPQSGPETLIVGRGHCLTDLINAFKGPKMIASEVCIKISVQNGELQQGGRKWRFARLPDRYFGWISTKAAHWELN